MNGTGEGLFSDRDKTIDSERGQSVRLPDSSHSYVPAPGIWYRDGATTGLSPPVWASPVGFRLCPKRPTGATLPKLWPTGPRDAGLTGKGSLIVLSADGQGDGVVPASVLNCQGQLGTFCPRNLLTDIPIFRRSFS